MVCSYDTIIIARHHLLTRQIETTNLYTPYILLLVYYVRIIIF